MRLQVGGSALLVIVCLVAAGCGAGVNGPVVTAQNPEAASPSRTVTVSLPSPSTTNLIPNGNFAAGIAPWEPAFDNSRLEVARTKAPFGHAALLVRPKTLAVPRFGASAPIVAEPVYRSRYRFECRVRGSSDLRLSIVVMQLQALAGSGDRWITVGTPMQTHVPRIWRKYSLTGSVPTRNTIEMRVLVYVRNSFSLNSWLAIGKVVAVRAGT